MVMFVSNSPLERTINLVAWSTLVCPELTVAGYNINNFDLPYLWERAKALRVDSEAHQWGRIRHR
jgi:DNA polymerase elongation subunit (family B)